MVKRGIWKIIWSSLFYQSWEWDKDTPLALWTSDASVCHILLEINCRVVLLPGWEESSSVSRSYWRSRVMVWVCERTLTFIFFLLESLFLLGAELQKHGGKVLILFSYFPLVGTWEGFIAPSMRSRSKSHQRRRSYRNHGYVIVQIKGERLRGIGDYTNNHKMTTARYMKNKRTQMNHKI